jgi:hypothetical protein
VLLIARNVLGSCKGEKSTKTKVRNEEKRIEEAERKKKRN